MTTVKMVKLGTLIKPAKLQKCGNDDYPVLSMTMHNGLVFQSDKFKKSVASQDKSTYKVVHRNQLVIGFPIDEGVLATQRITDAGIVSPAYGIWDVDQTKIVPEFLEYALRCNRAIDYYKAKLRGSTARRRSLPTPTLLELDVPLPDIEQQRLALTTIHHAKNALDSRQAQLTKLDELIKARFVEMFGDPVNNPLHWKKVKLSELADIKIGPFGSLLHKEDYVTGGHPLVNPSHIIDGKIIVDNDLTLTDEKYSELVSYHLKKDDIVLGRRGEMGRCAVVDREGLLCGTGSLLLRPTGVVTADYIQKIISFPTFKKTIEDMAVGQTMPNLNVPIVSNFMIILPPLSVQKEYYDFVAEVDKSKLLVVSAEAHKPFDIGFFSKSTVQRFIKEV